MSSTSITKWTCDRNPRHTAETAYAADSDPALKRSAPTGWTRVTREAIDATKFPPNHMDLCEGCSRQLQSFLINKDNVPVVATPEPYSVIPIGRGESS